MAGGRGSGTAGSEDEDGGVILLSSDDEANKDLSLEIAEQARLRDANRKLPNGDSDATAPPSFIDLCSASASDEEAAAADGVLVPLPQTEGTKRKRKRPKKEKVEETGDELVGVHVKEEVPSGTEEEVPSGTEDSVPKKNKKVEEIGDELVGVHDKEEGPSGTADSVITEANETSDNAVLRKLLRGPRYFDLGDRMLETCYNCGEEGHVAANCKMEKRQKPCFICGMFGHNSKQCMQGQDCFICKRRGHIAKNCPDKHKQIDEDSKICLRCGDVGHEMSSCKSDYAPDDLKEIQCYICKKFGHLFCFDFSFFGPREVSCYNCAQLGHTGLGCAKQRCETSSLASPTLCYKCGEEGHFSRGCTKSAKGSAKQRRGSSIVASSTLCYKCGEEGHFARWCTKSAKPSRWKGESSTPRRFPKKNRDSPGFKSVPRDFGRTGKNKDILNDERRDGTSRNSKRTGGWVADDPGEDPKTWPKANGLSSPRTPVRKSSKVHSNTSAGLFWSSQSPRKKQKSFAGMPSRHTSMDAYQHGYSASRFGNSHGHYGRM